MTQASYTIFDVILVGSGCMGSAIAYNLISQNPALKIALIERDASFEKSSTVLSDGNSRIQFNLPANIEISLYGLKMLAHFSETMAIDGTPVDVGFRQQGNIFIIDEAGEAYARAGIKNQQAAGGEVQWLEPDQVQELHPIFNPASCRGGTYGPKDGTMSPLDVLQGYRRKAISLGVQAITGEVTALLHINGQMSGVRLASGETLNGPIVASTAGVWATRLLADIGVDIPVSSIKRETYSIAIDQSFDNLLPLLLLPTGHYLLHEGGNHFITGGKGPADPETTTDFSWSRERFEQHMWEGLIPFLPALDRLKLLNGWAGLYAINDFDGNAILGEWPQLKGLYLANGFSGHGFQQCHGVGRYLADLMLGSTLELDLAALSPQRLLDNKPVFENPARLI
jgi:glycine/D-amino acid oxidase-like deaminating enzyme